MALETNLHIPKHTFSRLLHEFLQDKGIMKYNNSELHNIITESILKAIQEGIYERNDLQNYVNNFLILKDWMIHQIYLSKR
jgi:hypothetical protein